MRRITKGAEPRCLTEERAAGRSFEDIPGPCKQEMRKALAREQGALCCYCMARIQPKHTVMIVEHLVPQSHEERGDELATTWSNLFGACDGGRGLPQHLMHCDAAKADQQLTFSPSDAGFEALIAYRGDGELDASDAQLRHDLVNILRLNSGHLPANRKAALDGFLQSLRRDARAWDVDRIDRFIAELEEGAELVPFVGVVLYFLRKRRARC